MAKYSELFKIRTNDLDTFDRVKPYVYLDCFQDVAGHHADILGVGYEACKKENVAWVLMKNRIEIINTPLPYEEVEVITWPSSRSRIDYGRDYMMVSKTGEVYAKATSQWVFADMTTHKLLRTTALSFPEEVDETPLFEGKIEKIDIDDLVCERVVHTHKITNSDLDHYGHTNNARYVVMIFDALPNNKDKLIKSIVINYLQEAHLGEVVDLYLEEKAGYIIGCGKVKADGRLSFTFKLTF